MCRGDLLGAFRVAFAGLGYALRTQCNLRIQLVVTGIILVLGLWLGLPADQWAVLALTSGLVLLA